MESDYNRPNRRSVVLSHSPPSSSAFDNRGFTSDQSDYSQHRDPQFINRLSRVNFGKYDLDIPPLHLHSAVQPVVYEMDHLVTFDVGTRGGVTTPADGIRKLRQLEATSGIWTRRVLVSIDQRELVVSEKAGGEEVECFPISHVMDPISYTENSIPNVFNDLVIFVVRKESWTRQPSTMNIFQCIGGKQSNEVVEDIKAACAGKFPRSKSEAEVETKRISRTKFDEDSPKLRIKEKNGDGGDQLTGNALNNRVVLLNCCFDDIEEFVARLQESAKDLKTNRDSSNGHVTPPSKRKFVDALQKFKLALNLISELRGHLVNPSASDLVQSLFSPLELIVSVCRDQNGQPKFIENILTPLLTSDACQFLEKNLRDDDLRLWKSLGKTWTTPRESWSGPAPTNYVPKFRNSSNSDRNNQDSEARTSQLTNVSIVNENESNIRTSETKDVRTHETNGVSAQQSYLDQLKSNNARICVVTFTRNGNNDRELNVIAEEFVEVLDSSKNWWKIRNSRGSTGYAPKTVLKPIFGF